MGKGTNTTTNSTTTAPSSQAMSAYSNVLNQAQGVAATPYTPYTGELVAPFNQQQNAGVAGINQYANAAQPAINYATNQATASSSPLTAGQIQQYESPYTQQVVNATQNQFNNQNAQQQQGVVGNAIAQGALGGNRSAIAQAETANQEQLAQAPVIAGLENQGYNQAVNTAAGQQAIGLQGAGTIGNLGVAGQTAGESGAGAQLGAGTQQQATQQALDTANYGQFQNQQAYPYQQAQWLAGIDTGVGSQMGGTSNGTTTAPAPSQLGQIAGGLTSGVGLLGATGAFGSAGWMLPALAALARGGVAQIEEEIKRATGGAVNGVAGYAGGGSVRGYADGGWTSGVAGVPYGGAHGYIPSNSITHGSGAPHQGAPAPYQVPQNNLAKQASDLGSLAKSIKDGVNGDNPLPYGSNVPDAVGPTSVGGAPLQGVSNPYYGGGNASSGDAYGGNASAPLPGLDASDYGQMNRGGVAGYATGGAPDDDDSNVINPNEPYRLTDPAAMDTWRSGVDHPNAAIQADDNTPATNAVIPEKADGIAPSKHALAFNGDTKASNADLPDEVALGYSNGIAPASVRAANEGSTNGVSSGQDWGSGNKLWPSLISAGASMLASRSPFVGNAIGEGLQAGAGSYAAQTKQEQDAKQHADQLELERQRFERPYSEMTANEKASQSRQDTNDKRAAINQPVIIGPDGVAKVNPAYIAAKQAAEKDFKPTFIPGTPNPLTGELGPDRVYDPNTKTVTVVTPEGQPIAKPTPAPDIDTVKTVETSGMTGLNKAQTAAPYNYSVHAPTIEKGMDVPEPDLTYIPRASSASLKTDAAKYLQTGALPPAPVSRSTPLAIAAVNYRAAVQNYGNALAQSRGVSPDQLATMWRTAPDLPKFIIGTPGQATVSLGVAVSHLDVLRNLIDAFNSSDLPRLRAAQAVVSREFGQTAASNIDAASSIIGPEIIKAIGVAGAGTAEEREKTSQMFLKGGSQARDAITVTQRLMAGQLEGKQRQAEAVGMSPDMFKGLIGTRAYDLLTNLDKGAGASGSAMSSQDQLALGWANANPNDPRAAAIKKKLGIQ